MCDMDCDPADDRKAILATIAIRNRLAAKQSDQNSDQVDGCKCKQGKPNQGTCSGLCSGGCKCSHKKCGPPAEVVQNPSHP